MPSPEISQALTDRELILLHREIVELQQDKDRDIAELRAEIETMRRERDKALLWGIMALGGAVVGMALYIFNLITGGRHG